MSLREYEKKRDFRKTPEPSGNGEAKTGHAKNSSCQFVVQKHDASRLHYDFRLELGGTLKSWAVPKGPSLDPKVKSLAVQVEDHPLSYAGFEGVIPEGEYGGGTVMVWDRGEWIPEGDAAKDYRAGKLKFELEGEKLHGSWALVRMGGRAGDGGKNWLLIKHNDDAARLTEKYDVLKKEPLSVVSQRNLPEIAEAADRTWHSNVRPAKIAKKAKQKSASRAATSKPASRSLAKTTGAREANQPTKLQPQLATLAQEVPTGDGWLHELKFDGYRILAFLKNGRVRLMSRNGKHWTKRFPRIAKAVGELPLKGAILDGEIVALNDKGIPEFQRLQNSLSAHDDAELVYYVFDLPYCDGYNLTGVRLDERKDILQTHALASLKSNDSLIRFSDHVVGQGEEVLRQACGSAMEGIVSKRADAPYEHSRSRTWLKVKCTQRQEFVICGYTKPTGARVGLGALLLGYHQDGKLVYAGRVGTGFTDESLRALTKRLKELRTTESPFNKPLTTAQRRGVAWVKPKLVGEVEFTEWTAEGLLRHPSFQGLREDKPASTITREKAISMKGRSRAARSTSVARKVSRRASSTITSTADSIVAGVAITHPDRVLYPEMGLTKLDLAHYYESVADWILPHIVDRPLTLVRCPGGRDKQCFYQKHIAGALPLGIREVSIKEKTGADQYLVIDDLPGLIALVQMGVLEFHPWPARADNVEAPDRLIFDLDPGEGVTLADVIVATRELHERLAEIGLETFLRTSGGKGFHVVAPLSRRNSWDELKEFAKAVADDMVRQAPERYIATLSKAKRRDKIFVDYLRNQRGSTAVASYSTRARANAPVATPLTWKELTARMKPDHITVANVGKRLAKLAVDPWADFSTVRQSLTKAMFAALDSPRSRSVLAVVLVIWMARVGTIRAVVSGRPIVPIVSILPAPTEHTRRPQLPPWSGCPIWTIRDRFRSHRVVPQYASLVCFAARRHLPPVFLQILACAVMCGIASAQEVLPVSAQVEASSAIIPASPVADEYLPPYYLSQAPEPLPTAEDAGSEELSGVTTDDEVASDPLANPAQPLSPEVEALLKRIEALEASLAEKAELPEGKDEKAEEPAKKDPLEGWTDTSLEKWTVKLGGHVQADWIQWANTDPNISSNPLGATARDYFEFRRLRLMADGTGYGVYDFRIQIDIEPESGDQVTTPVTDIKDAYFSLNELPGNSRWRIGNFFVPFSLEQVTNDTMNIFMERSIPTQGIFSADREVGMAIYGHTDDLNTTWAGGTFFDSISESLKERIDDNQGQRLSGRLTHLLYYDEPSNGRYLVHTGCGVLYTNDQDDAVRFRARPQIHEGPFLIDSGNLLAGSYTTGNLEFATVWGRASVQSEAFLSNVNFIGAPSQSVGGAYVYGSWFLTGENRVYERFGQHGAQFGRNVPFTNVFWVPGGVGWGAWEAKCRWSNLTLNEVDHGQYNDITTGFNWYWSDRVRCMFDWIHPVTAAGTTPFGATHSDIIAMRFDFNF